MNKCDPSSFAAPTQSLQDITNDNAALTVKATTQYLRQQVRNINVQLLEAYRNGHTKNIDQWSKKLKQTNQDLLVIRQQINDAELGAVFSLLHCTGDGTSQRQWKQVHTTGAKWLEKTREHRRHTRIIDRERALKPGTIKARRTLSPLLQKKVTKIKLQSEQEMEEFSYRCHRLNRPNGSSRRITYHITSYM